MSLRSDFQTMARVYSGRPFIICTYMLDTAGKTLGRC